jgi:hypothetical protein
MNNVKHETAANWFSKNFVGENARMLAGRWSSAKMYAKFSRRGHIKSFAYTQTVA